MAGVGKQTVQSVREYVTAHPGSRTDAVMWALDMSQATASAALKELVEEGYLRYRMNEETGKRCFPFQFEAAGKGEEEAKGAEPVPAPKERPRLRAEKQGTGHVLVPDLPEEPGPDEPYIVWTRHLLTGDGDRRVFVPHGYKSLDQVRSDVDNGTLMVGNFLLTKRVVVATTVTFTE